MRAVYCPLAAWAMGSPVIKWRTEGCGAMNKLCGDSYIFMTPQVVAVEYSQKVIEKTSIPMDQSKLL